tara:strand:+ start:940 stop:3438 length:2499 start_codon:yes stop_codon:yes gene_type:complete
MVIAATNDGPAFVKAYPVGGGGDPFDLANTMREFRMQMGTGKLGAGRLCELSLIAPSASAEKELLEFLGKNSEENSYEFEWGWEGGGTSDKVTAAFVNVEYAVNLGSEVTMKVTFAVTNNQIKNSISGKKATKTRRVSSEKPKKGLSKAVGKLIAKVCKVPGLTTAVSIPEGLLKNIDGKMDAFKESIKDGLNPSSKEGGDGVPGESGGAETYKARELGIMNDSIASDEACMSLLAESPFSYKLGTGSKISDPTSIEGQLRSLWGSDRREAEDDPWGRYDRDYDDSPLVGTNSLTLDIRDPYDVLLGEEESPLEVPATHKTNFIPSIEGASESMERFSALRSTFISNVNYSKWSIQYPGRVEYWAGGSDRKTIFDDKTFNLVTWVRGDDGAWDSFIPSLSHVSKFYTSLGSNTNDFYSEAVFEIPPQEETAASEYGPGVWMFRLTNDATADISLHVARQNARLSIVDTLIASEFMPSPPNSQTTHAYEDGGFLFNASPFNSTDFQSLAATTGSEGGGGSIISGDDSAYVVLAIKEGEDIESWLSGILAWLNEFATEEEVLGYRVFDGADIEKGKLKDAVSNPKKGKHYLIIAPLADMGPDLSNVKAQTSFPWVGGKDLTLEVGGWQSVVEGLNVNTTVVAAVPWRGQTDQGKLKSKEDAESGKGGESAKKNYDKEPTAEELKAGAWAAGGGEPEKAAEEILKPEDEKASFNGEEVDSAKTESGSIAPKTAEASDKKEASDAAKAKAIAAAVNWGSAAFKVTVTCLGLPEICGVNEVARNVKLNMPDVRTGTGSHGLSGNYMIVDYQHIISVEQGFKTKLVLHTKGGNEFTKA